MSRHIKIAPTQQARGFSLLEVLITVLILSLGLLGMAGLTGSSLQMAKLSQFQNAALQLATEYADRIRSNADGAEGGAYDMGTKYDGSTSAQTVPTCTAPCTAADIAAIDQAEWKNNLQQRLPAGGAWVTRSDRTFDIWVMWQDAGKTDSNAVQGGLKCPDEAMSSGTIASCFYYRVQL